MIFGLIGLWCGIIALRSWLQVKKTGDITKSVFYPNDNNGVRKVCKDKAAYIKETNSKLLITGCVAVIYGGAEFVNAMVVPVEGVLIAIMFLTVMVLIWAGFSVGKMNKKYF